MANNRKASSSNDTTALTTAQVAATDDENNPNLDDYAQQADLPLYVAPITPSLNFPLIKYSKGVTVVSGIKPQKKTVFHIGIEQSAEIDTIFEGQGVPAVRVRHKNGNEESYWEFESIKGYILCTAVPDSYGPDAWRRTGIPYVWNEHRDTYNYGSQLQCLFFMKGLLEVGYTQPLVLTLSRTVTEHFVNKVLHRQAAMIEAVKKAMKKRGKSDEIAFYAYWLELVKSPEEVTTKGGGSYYPPITTIPGPLTVGYVKEHQAPLAHVTAVEAYLPVLAQWAEATSAKLLEPPRDNAAAAPEQPEQPGEEVE
jgi:hypothetical protein